MDSILRPSDRDNHPSLDVDPQKSALEAWEHIRELDEVENWAERNRVVSKSDHLLYSKCAQEFMSELLDGLPVFMEQLDKPTSLEGEEQEWVERREQVAGKRMEQVDDVGGDYQYMSKFSDQDFQTTAAQLDVDYLEQMSSSTSNEPIALARQSLYVKFDPLVGGASPKQSAHKNIPTAMMVGRTPSNDLLMLDTPPSGDSSATSSRSHDLLTISPGNEWVGQRGSSRKAESFASQSVEASPRLNSTLLDSSPQLATPPRPTPSHHTTFTTPNPETGNLIKVLEFAEEDVVQLVETARQEERIKFEAEMAVLKEELSRKETIAQKRVDRAQREVQAMRAEIMMHVSDKAKLEEEVERWRQLVECHEDTETKLCDRYEELKGEVSKLEKQRDQTLADFESLEKSFADLHERYLKLKSTAQTFQKNEAKLKGYVSELEGLNQAAEERFQTLQQELQEKLAEANQTFDSLRKEHTSDVAVTKANAKKLQLQVASLEKALEGKNQEKEELAQICDELMKELGNRN